MGGVGGEWEEGEDALRAAALMSRLAARALPEVKGVVSVPSPCVAATVEGRED